MTGTAGASAGMAGATTGASTGAWETVAGAFETVSGAFENVAGAFETVASAFETVAGAAGALGGVETAEEAVGFAFFVDFRCDLVDASGRYIGRTRWSLLRSFGSCGLLANVPTYPPG